MKKQTKKITASHNRLLPTLLGTKRTRQVLNQNPNTTPVRELTKEIKISVHDYNESDYNVHELVSVKECFPFLHSNTISWINIDGIRKQDVDEVCSHFGVHPLIQEDILSVNQRPKMEEGEAVLFCLLNMLYYNNELHAIEQEQISIVLLKNVVISFQEDATKDVFTPLREKLKLPSGRVRQSGADRLCCEMLDLIVDHYFVVMDALSDRIELLEEEVVRKSNKQCLEKISVLRKELVVLKRNVVPVRELVSGFIKSDSDLLHSNTFKYFKDVQDHAIQANDLCESYRDMVTNIQDLYVSNINLRLNEIMKWLTILTSILAPATVISSFLGMNFETISTIHTPTAFVVSVCLMILIPAVMVLFFKKRGWF